MGYICHGRIIGRAVIVSALIGLAALGASPSPAWGDPAQGSTALSAKPRPATPGTYRYQQTNPASPAGEGTLVVGLLTSGTQHWTRDFGSNVPVSTSVMSYRGTGIYTVSRTDKMSGSTVSCTFATPVPSPPWPMTVGKAFSGQGACTAQAVLSVSGKIVGHAVLPLDGKSVNTAVVDSAANMTVTYLGTTYEVDVTEVDWFAPSLRMPVQTTLHIVVPSQSSTSDSTYVLESSTPS